MAQEWKVGDGEGAASQLQEVIEPLLGVLGRIADALERQADQVEWSHEEADRIMIMADAPQPEDYRTTLRAPAETVEGRAAGFISRVRNLQARFPDLTRQAIIDEVRHQMRREQDVALQGHELRNTPMWQVPTRAATRQELAQAIDPTRLPDFRFPERFIDQAMATPGNIYWEAAVPIPTWTPTTPPPPVTAGLGAAAGQWTVETPGEPGTLVPITDIITDQAATPNERAVVAAVDATRAILGEWVDYPNPRAGGDDPTGR
jgi:hypothetical protein